MIQAYLTKIDRRSFILLLLGLVLVILLLPIGTVFIPTWKAYQAQLAAKLATQAIVDSGNQLKQQITALKSSSTALKAKINQSDLGMSKQRLEAYLVGELQKLSWQHKIKLVSIQPRLGEELSLFKPVLLELQLAGDYFNLYRWLQAVKTHLPYLHTKIFELQKLTPSKTDKNISIKLTMVYFLRTGDE